MNTLAPGILVHHDAKSGLEGKFSLEYSLAVYLLHGPEQHVQIQGRTAPVGHDRSSTWDRLERAPLRGSAVPFAGKMLYALRR